MRTVDRGFGKCGVRVSLDSEVLVLGRQQVDLMWSVVSDSTPVVY